MLTVEQINHVSFGKSGFNGYKPTDVDDFIDEVATSFEQLLKERDEALENAQQLAEENATLTEKLAVLAEKIENYREDEDGIKEALLNAQRIGKRSVEDAKDKATLILQDAKDEANNLLDSAKMDASRAVQEYNQQIEAKKEELEEMKRQVSAFRTSLMEMYRKHLECIDHIPVFKTKERAEINDQPEISTSEQTSHDVPVEDAATEVEELVSSAEHSHSDTAEDATQEVAHPQKPERSRDGKRTLHDRVDFTKEEGSYEDLSDVGIDLKAYNNIPESLRQEKSSHYSHLEFGEDVDLGRKKRKK